MSLLFFWEDKRGEFQQYYQPPPPQYPPSRVLSSRLMTAGGGVEFRLRAPISTVLGAGIPLPLSLRFYAHSRPFPRYKIIWLIKYGDSASAGSFPQCVCLLERRHCFACWVEAFKYNSLSLLSSCFLPDRTEACLRFVLQVDVTIEAMFPSLSSQTFPALFQLQRVLIIDFLGELENLYYVDDASKVRYHLFHTAYSRCA